jgi:glycosyltransferase involved in cell wall biosynthesis
MRKVTVGIPAYNEEKNISNLLKSIEGQAGGLVHEVIISDDSSDGTPEAVRKFSSQTRLDVVHLHHKKRRGAAAAWNEIFMRASGDAIVLYDADTVPAPDCTARLVASLGDASLCASNSQPVPAKGIAGRASAFISSWLQSMRQAGLSKYTAMGRGLSIDALAAKKIAVPNDIIAIDLYLQCKVLEMGLGVKYDNEAIVYFQPAASMEDLASQVIRAVNGHCQLREYVARMGMNLPLSIILNRTARAMASDPLGAVSTAIGYARIPYYKRRLAGTNSALWHTATSSKSVDLRVPDGSMSHTFL